ncbi:AGAP001648-PA-like protein [Anopheles sinensis]|uniref:CLIP domain-containing serine protease n=1 Tax=Anopheles sinensis TaxID=74873 RepID=A0A084VGT9_ANOSI|nr:AGAP001648-PA-like protein [Anopheles sinensis]
MLTCNDAKDRCVPMMNCRPFSKLVKANKSKEASFKKLLRQGICKPEAEAQRTHVCCPKKQIDCTFNGKPGVCALKPNCPHLQSMEETNIPQESLCYVRNRKNYYCCTDPLCVIQPGLCDQDHSSTLVSPPSAFPKCTIKRKAGLTVPKQLCDYNYAPSNAYNPVDLVCCGKEQPNRLVAHLKAAKLAKMVCGKIDTNSNKIWNGTHAEEGEFPWMANLVYRRRGVSCSGTLIHPSYVLTAEHCVKPGLTKVRLGLRDLRKAAQSTEMQEISIAQRITYNMHDVALLRLAKPADIEGSMVRPICLPLYANLRMSVPKKLTIAGWGTTETQKLSPILLKADTPVVSPENEECPNKFEVCIGGETAQSNQCAGDSGGPYQAMDVFNGNMRYVQFGIISNGQATCRSAQKLNNGLLVGYILDWILDNMIL